MNIQSVKNSWQNFRVNRGFGTKSTESANDERVYISLENLLDLRLLTCPPLKQSTKRVHNGLSGEAQSIRKGHGIEFEDIRPYQSGDDLRQFDWRVAARTGKPFTRRYTEDLERSILVVCDQRVNMFFGSGECFKSYRAAIEATKIAWLAYTRSYRIGGVIASDTVEIIAAGNPGRSVLGFCDRMVSHNHRLNINTPANIKLHDILHGIRHVLKAGMDVTIISDFNDLDRETAQTIADIARKSVLTLHQILDPLEQTMSVSGTVGISDGSHVKRVKIGARERRNYLDKRARISQLLQDLAIQSGSTLLIKDSDATR